MGEDSYYTSKDCISVFDGVGSWADDGVDAREYSSKLALYTQEAVEVRRMTDPLAIMNYAYEGAMDVTGTSTAVILVLNSSNKTIHAANLGDSQFVVIRNGQVILESSEQQVKFNTPYQMGTRSDIKPSTHAEIYTLGVEPNDVIVMGTDGLFDNVFPKTMVHVVKKGKNPKEMAKELSNIAYLNSRKPNVSSPFAKLAKKNKIKWSGGKPDDITVIVAKVKCVSQTD